MATEKKYWKGLEELNEAPHFVEKRDNEFPAELAVEEFVGSDKVSDFKSGRRDFLKFLGFSVAAASLAACEKPVIKAIPYVNKPEDVTPGVASWYASTYYDGNDFANVLVKAREARPIHIKGNKNYGVTQGGINARIGASVLSMYNGARLKQPQIKTEAGFSDLSWADADAKVKAGLNKAIAGGKSVRILSRSIISPSTEMSIKALVSSYGGSVTSAMASEPVATGGADSVAVDTVAPVASGSADVKHVVYDAVSYHGIRKANETSFGKADIPSYDFSKAKTIVGIGCDFLNSWLLSTQYAVQYGVTRNPDKNENKEMSKHFQFESLMSVTGSNADVRTRIKPSQEGIVAAGILNALGGGGASAGELDAACKKAAESLKANAGHSLVVAGSNDPKVQTIVNAINDMLGNYGTTLDLAKPTTLGQTNDEEVATFVEELKGGKVGAVIVYDTNPVYSMPNGGEIAEAIAACDFSVSMAMYNDETASACHVICPDNHYLESWNDYSPVTGHYALAQPICRPSMDTRQAQESFLVWAGTAERGTKDSKTYYEFIQDGWRQFGFPNQNEYSTFADYWNWTVHNGSVEMPMPSGSQPSFSGTIPTISAGKEVAYELVTYQKSAIGTGNQAANPWLQEMPDPMSKVSWDNYATMAPADAMHLFGTGEGEIDTFAKWDQLYLGEQYPAKVITVTVGEKTLKLPVYPMPGQAVGTVGVALGYGRGAHATKEPLIGRAAYQTEEYGGHTLDENENLTPIGGNVFGMTSIVDGAVCYSGMEATLTLITEEKYPLACAQTHNTVMGRVSVVKETTLDYYQNGPKENTATEKGYNPPFTVSMIEDGEHKTKKVSEVDLWDEHPVANIGHRWGMSIDLSTCIGCASCLIACQSENNVPVVGKDEVRRSRDMHWLRIDRYFSSIEDEQREITRNAPWEGNYDYRKMEVPEASPEVTFMPMMCQHCNHAPCETVCPVAATTHSNEGLNQMTYNRCIGTRYCANNCPYKVRRFNWFNYQGYKKFSDVNPAQDQLGRMVLNPDVVVRSRGVMEKCSFCVQKIQSGKLVAKKAGRPVQDGDVTTACAESCPTNAISFGDWNDTKSEVRGLSEGDRAYQSLEEVGVEPNIWYQLKVRNHDEKAPQEIGVTEVAATDHVADEHNEAH